LWVSAFEPIEQLCSLIRKQVWTRVGCRLWGHRARGARAAVGFEHAVAHIRGTKAVETHVEMRIRSVPVVDFGRNPAVSSEMASQLLTQRFCSPSIRHEALPYNCSLAAQTDSRNRDGRDRMLGRILAADAWLDS
jgi:hypothetical protein